MAKTTKPERRALEAMEDAAAAAKIAKRAAKDLPRKIAKSVKDAAADARDAADVSKKQVRKNPRKVEKRAAKATNAALAATDDAIAKAEKRAEKKADAERAAAEKAAEKKAAEKKAAEKKAAEKKKHAAAAPSRTNSTDPAESDAPATVQPAEPVASVEIVQAPAADDLSSLTVAALRDRAKAEGRTGYSRFTKAQLVELLS